MDNMEELNKHHKHHKDDFHSVDEYPSLYVELKNRWKAEIPKFWSKVLKTAIAVGSSAIAVVSADQLFGLQAYGVPQIIFTISGYIIVACAAIGLSAKITKQ